MKSPVTQALVLINLLVFLGVELFFGFTGDQSAFHDFVFRYGLVPAEFWAGAWWQPITSMFLHGGMLHVMVNMLALWSLGTPIERTVTSYRFLWLYMVSGFTSALFVFLFQPDLGQPTVGASGAVFGLLGSLAVFFPNSMLLVFFIPMRARTAAVVFGLLSLIFIFFDNITNISHLGHLGGLVGGVLYSKFALGLRIGRGSLYEFSGMRPPESDPEDDPLRDFAERLRRNSDIYGQNRGQRTVINPFGRREKIINPLPEEKEPEPHSDSGEVRIYFDPQTGRFYTK